MNFGNWIVVAFILFAVFIGTLVAVCVSQDISLVSKNYYNDELLYQDQITRINNANALGKKPTIVKSGNSVHVTFDEDLTIAKGELKLFCPSDPSKDRAFSLTPDNKQLFDVTLARSGMYKAKLQWTMGDKEYFIEEIIYL